MKKARLRAINRPRFVVDINTSFDGLKKRYGGFAVFKSVVSLTKKQDASDDEIIKQADSGNYHIITQNTKHFREAPLRFRTLTIGLICINLQEGGFLDKFGSLLRKLDKHEKFNKKLVIIGNEVQVVSYQRLKE